MRPAASTGAPAAAPVSSPFPSLQNAPASAPGGLVAIAGPARRAWPWLRDLVFVEAGTILVGPAGETLRVSDGGVEPVLPGGYPRGGIASDPAPGRRLTAGEPR